jgi:hypothetical protein
MVLEQPRPSATPRDADQEKCREKPVGEFSPRWNQQSRPAASKSCYLCHRNPPQQEGRQMTGRRGTGSKEAPVAQATNVPPPTEPAPHQPRRKRPLEASVSNCRHLAPLHRPHGDSTAGELHRRRSGPEAARSSIRGGGYATSTPDRHRQPWHHGTAGVSPLGRR